MPRKVCIFCKGQIRLEGNETRIFPDLKFKGKFVCRNCYEDLDRLARGME